MFLSQFQMIRPQYERPQGALQDWIVKSHGHGQTQEFSKLLQTRMDSIGLGEERISSRGTSVVDCTHELWDEMELYPPHMPKGALLEKRMECFDKIALDVFERFYPKKSTLPGALVHVTCTGYSAPSPGQRLIALRGGYKTRVLHAYHMGCYGAIPAIYMGMGALCQDVNWVDIVHTEIASIHLDPSSHSKEQLLVQSLFADGFIKYSLTKEPIFPCFEVLATGEEIVADSLEQMSWKLTSHNFVMTLSKKIPVSILRALGPFLEELVKKAGVDIEQIAHFAIHPGGPKIIDQVAGFLRLEEDQVNHSRSVLTSFGNMSSATLPHVWMNLLNEEKVADGQMVVSLAFGPGLTISGAILKKIKRM